MPRKTAAAKRNIRIRQHLADTGVLMWQMAEELNMSASNLYVLFRKEQPEEIKERWIAVIDKIAAQNVAD